MLFVLSSHLVDFRVGVQHEDWGEPLCKKTANQITKVFAHLSSFWKNCVCKVAVEGSYVLSCASLWKGRAREGKGLQGRILAFLITSPLKQREIKKRQGSFTSHINSMSVINESLSKCPGKRNHLLQPISKQKVLGCLSILHCNVITLEI